jgi:Asp/Glu/hydantoin racemase
MLRDLIRKLGLQSRVCGIHSINENDDVGAIAASLATAAREGGASRIVVGGAGLIPLIPGIVEACPVPIFDPHRAAVRKAIHMAQGRSDAAGIRFQERTKGLSEPLRRVFSSSELASPPAGNAH